jgi:hypothetical protein
MEHGLGGVAFENETGRRLRTLGWQVETTAVTGDWGADLIARAGNEIVVVQCKDYGSPAGVAAIQEVHFARTHYRATGAVVVARNGFTKAAIKAAAQTGVEIWQPHDIAPGSHLDRTAFRQRLDIERVAAERERELSKLWHDYDVSVTAVKRSILTRRLVLCAIGISFAVYLIWSAASSSAINPVTSLPLFCALLYRKPIRPARPDTDRRGAIIRCDICLSRLRVEYGRVGHVRCPRCKVLTSAST